MPAPTVNAIRLRSDAHPLYDKWESVRASILRLAANLARAGHLQAAHRLRDLADEMGGYPKEMPRLKETP